MGARRTKVELFDQLNRLKEATRVRVTPEAIEWLREHAEAMHACADNLEDRTAAHALRVLIDMHDNLEALRG